MRGRIAVLRGQARVSQLKPKSKGATFNSVFGEIRGGEAFDLLQLLNTGHSGTLCTVHANSAGQGISRVTTCVLQSAVEMPYAAIQANIAESLNVIVQLERRRGRRYVSEVAAICGYDLAKNSYQLESVFGAATVHGRSTIFARCGSIDSPTPASTLPRTSFNVILYRYG